MIAAVIPAWNEAMTLPRTIEALRTQSEIDEIVVVDGGSEDGTPDLVEPPERCVRSEPGRCRQMNRGVGETRAPILLFVHADTAVPPGAGAAILDAVRRGFEGGAFLARFDDAGLLFRLGDAYRNVRSRLFTHFYGDQAIFATRAAFRALGGFRPLPSMEDLDFCRRLRRRGRATVLPLTVTTSARRYRRHGIVRQHLLNQWLKVRFALGNGHGA